MLTDNWHELSPEEKFEKRFEVWMNPKNIEFKTPEAEENYKRITQAIKDAVQLKKPELIPILLNVGFFPAEYAGVTGEDMMYDYEKLGQAWKKFHYDFKPDVYSSCFIIGPAKVFEMLDYKLYQWPGHGTDPNTSYQCLEDEYMHEDEYDLLIADPSAYWMRYYLPRIFGALEPWKNLSPFTDLVELPFVGAFMIPIGLPEVQESFKKYIEAGQAALEWIGAVQEIDNEIIANLGIPPVLSAFSKAPFDTLGDTLRGTRPILLDMFRRPDKLKEAMERLVPIMIEMGVRSATANANPFVFMPLHKGADGFMSNKDFAEFYWPTLKAVILGLIEEGLVPYLFVEGSYNQRLEFLADPDLPEGKIVWIFDQTDMKEAKRILGGKACIGGNVPGSMLKAGTPQEVENYVRDLMETVGKDGGFMLSNGAVLDNAEPANLHAMIETCKKYGR